jgi:toxin YoeB
MEINLSPKAKLHLEEIDKDGNVAKRRKVEKLMQSILDSPYHGIGKPEPLKH